MSRPMEAFEAGLLALGYAVGGTREAPNQRMARRVLASATATDAQLADAWLGRLAAGDCSLEVYRGLWQARRHLGSALSRYGLRPETLGVFYESGMLIRAPIADADRATASYVAALCAAGEFGAAVDVFTPALSASTPFTRFAAAALYYQTERWPQVIEVALPLRDHADLVLAAAARALSGHAQAHLGLYQAAVATACEALSNGKTIIETLPDATAGVSYFLGGAYRALGEDTLAAEALRAALVADPAHKAAAELAADPGLRLATVDQAMIDSRTDPWNPATASDPDALADEQHAEARQLARDKAMAKLNEQIGLAGVKREVAKLEATVRVNTARLEAGLPEVLRSHHVVLAGPPGTGKTTVAKTIAGLYYGLGILRTPKFVEAKPADLVAGYVGQTAIKTNDVVDSALDGVLMIDEAYAIIDADNPSAAAFGKQCVDTLLARIENDRDRLVVILAGYEADMTRFLATNPGLASRFPKRISFPSYDAGELVQIARGIAGKTESRFDDAAAAALLQACGHLVTHDIADDKHGGVLRPMIDVCGNGRFIRNVVEDALSEVAVRLTADPAHTGPFNTAALTTITAADVRPALDTVITATLGQEVGWDS